MDVKEDTEMRKLSIGQMCQLVQILEFNKDWKKLMSLIRGDGFNFEQEERKYNCDHVDIIEKVSDSRPKAEIFLDEWGTSGRNRPTVGLLLQYLLEAKLFRATAFVAELLKIPTPDDRTSIEIYSEFDSTEPPALCIHKENTVLVGNEDMAQSKDDGSCQKKIPFHYVKVATNHFHDNHKIGSGGFGIIYKGKINGKDLAIKVLNKDAILQFEQERLLLLEGIKHKNLLPPLATTESVALNVYCLLYEYMPHGSLEDRLALKNPKLISLSWKKRFSIALDIAEGLQHLHNSNIVHRDIKSSNILLDENDIAKISDFGVIRMKNDCKSMVTSSVKGTTAYMAPEAFRLVISPKMDVYSFGLVLLELLTGLPIIDESREHLMYRIDEEMENNGSIKKFLDVTAGEWNFSVAEQLNEVAWNCLEHNIKERCDMCKVNIELKKLHQMVAQDDSYVGSNQQQLISTLAQ